jgi:1-acyl-sn-glycerol-3-phosphate acyltransferase
VLYAILKPIAAALAWILFRLRVRGQAHVPRRGAVLLVANHLSVLDPPVVGVAAPRPLDFMAKEELFRVPVLGALIRRLNAHPVRRDGSDSRALKAALALLAEGRALLVFPEGTRGEEGRLNPARPGAGMLALLSGAPVVPVHVSGTSRALPRGRAWPRRTRVRVAFGPALSFKPLGDGDGQGRKEQYHEAAQEMMRSIQQLMDDGDGDDVRRGT